LRLPVPVCCQRATTYFTQETIFFVLAVNQTNQALRQTWAQIRRSKISGTQHAIQPNGEHIMKSFIQRKLLVALIASGTLGLAGCFGSGSSGISPPPGTKATINIVNESSSVYARAVLLDQNSNVLVEQEINCKAAQTDCEVFLQNTLNEQQNTLLLQDGQRQLIRAFQAQGSELTESYIHPSNVSTGLYLTQRLQETYLIKEAIPADEIFIRLQQFFENYKSPDGLPEFNEELGEYYAKQRAANPSLTEVQFLEVLAKRLKDWSVATPDELPTSLLAMQASLSAGQKLANAFNDLVAGKVRLIRVAYAAETSGCSTALSTFITASQASAQAIPIAGAVISELLNIAKDSCSTTDSELNAINSKLDTLQNTVGTVGETLAQAKALGESGWINSQTQTFKGLKDLGAKAIKSHNDFLTYNTIDGKRAATLEDWFAKKGGYIKATSDLITKASVLEVLKSMNTLLEEMTKVTTDSNLETYYTALNNQCKDINTNSFTSSNFVATRQSCNNALLANAAYLMGAEAMVLPMARDIFLVLDKYSKEEGPVVYNDVKLPFISTELTAKYKDGNLKIESYDGAYEKTKTIFAFQQDEFLRALKEKVGHGSTGYFNPFAGLSTDLLTRIGNVCGKKESGVTTNVPAIVGWYAPKGVEADNYIVTNCYLINGNLSTMHPVKAKYYYYIDLDTKKPKVSPVPNYGALINVMGVLADQTPVMPWDISDTAPYMSFERFTSTEKGLVFYAPRLEAYSQVGVSAASNPITYITNGVYIPTYSAPGPERLNYLYKTDNPGPGYYKALLDSESASVANPNWLLFKDSEGYYHVTLMILNRATGMIVSLHCKTPDCSVGTGKEWLKYKGSDLVLDFSYMSSHAYVDNMYVYQLGPLK
jgi:hypothetical protein